MNDPIDRQAAIDAICKEGTRLERNGTVAMREIKQWCVDLLEQLPSAQPEYDENDLDFVQPHKRIPVQLVVSSDCISGEDASMMFIEVMKKLGKNDNISACCGSRAERRTDE